MNPRAPDRFRHHPPSERERMINETSAFLSWALRHQADLPRIPRRPVEAGGFTSLLKRPGGRAAVRHWWHRTLDRIGW